MPYSSSKETFEAFGDRVLDSLMEHGFYTASERAALETLSRMPRVDAPLAAVCDPAQSGSLVAVHPIRELWLHFVGAKREAEKLPPEPPSFPDHQAHGEIRRAGGDHTLAHGRRHPAQTCGSDAGIGENISGCWPHRCQGRGFRDASSWLQTKRR